MKELDYKICKRLKEAGFPQHSSKIICLHSPISSEQEMSHRYILDECESAVIPTLEELIEAVGTGTGNSVFNLYGHFTHDFGWEAIWTDIVSKEPPKIEETKTWESTPIKAVAELFIKLNEKK